MRLISPAQACSGDYFFPRSIGQLTMPNFAETGVCPLVQGGHIIALDED